MENEKQIIEEDSEAIVINAVETLKESLIESKVRRSPELIHINDSRLGITLELHSCKVSVKQLINEALKTFHKLKDRTSTKSISMIN